MALCLMLSNALAAWKQPGGTGRAGHPQAGTGDREGEVRLLQALPLGLASIHINPRRSPWRPSTGTAWAQRLPALQC